MLLFLAEGVLSVTAHKKETFNLKVRALDPAVIENHLTCTVYYDGRAKMPYHGTIMKPQLQENRGQVLHRAYCRKKTGVRSCIVRTVGRDGKRS